MLWTVLWISFFLTVLLQSLKKISKFVNTNILPGATAEVGLLCCACVLSNPEEAGVLLIKPILLSITSSFEGTAITGFVGREVSSSLSSTKVTPAHCRHTVLNYHSASYCELNLFAGYNFSGSRNSTWIPPESISYCHQLWWSCFTSLQGWIEEGNYICISGSIMEGPSAAFSIALKF